MRAVTACGACLRYLPLLALRGASEVVAQSGHDARYRLGDQELVVGRQERRLSEDRGAADLPLRTGEREDLRPAACLID
jgi:hypothetical protein